MKGNLQKSYLLIVLAVLVAFIGTANAWGPMRKGKAADKAWSALDNVERLKGTLDKGGFAWQEGSVEYMDWVKDTCEGKMKDTAFNNPWPQAYATFTLPAHEGVGNPPADWAWQLREDEAVVLVGQTPPAAAYFSYQTILAFLPISPWPPPQGYRAQRFGPPVGDTINIATINTIGPDRVNRPIVYIITGHRETERRVRMALLAAGYPAAIINVETIAPALSPLGIKDEGSWFYFAHRAAVPGNEHAMEEYLQDIGNLYKVFRVTPKKPLQPDPEPVPTLRVRGTGRTEMDLYPALKRLRQAIQDRYVGMQQTEMDTHVFTATTWDGRPLIAEKPYVGLQRGIQLLGATRDTNYLGTYPNFMLREGTGEFVIAYGVNHQKSGKTTYSSVSLYADPVRWVGVGTMLSNKFEGSAEQYLPDDPEAEMLYAIKVTRNCNNEAYCLEIKQPDFKDINGNTYTCNPPLDLNEQPMFIIFRSYMEPSTKVSPDDNELLYDRAIYFNP